MEPFAKLKQQQMLPSARSLVFIVDAMNECGVANSWSLMAKHLIEISELTDWLKILITSRPLVELERHFSPSPTVLPFDLNAVNAENDLEKFAISSLQNLVSDVGLRERWLRDDIVKELTSRASGLFIWISTMMELCTKRTIRTGNRDDSCGNWRR